jgi:CRISPR system Cascade subunit CasA
MNPIFNLIEEPWLRVLRPGGEVEELGLHDVLAQAGEIRELADDSLLVNVVELRLLLAILHAAAWRDDALGQKRRKWEQWWNDRALPLDDIETYFKKWRSRFDLFDEKFPFLQTGGLEMDKKSELIRLALEDNPTEGHRLFNYPENPIWENSTPSHAARLLLATQGFALGFGQSSKAKINGVEIEPPYTKDAPLLRGLTVWLTGETLLETLLLNLAPTDPDEFPEDAPSWELDAPHELRDKQVGKERRSTPVRGVMDNFSFHARLIRLLPEIENERVVVRNLYFTQGRSITDAQHFDPMKVYITSQKEGMFALSLSENRAAWRDAAAIFHTPATGHPCRAVEWVAEQVELAQIESHTLYLLHAIGLATDQKNKAKFLLWRHDRMPAPVSLLRDANSAGRIAQATEDAKEIADQLKDRFRWVAKTFDAPTIDQEAIKKHTSDAVNNLVNAFDPCRSFWTRLEAPFHEYLRRLPDEPETAWSDWQERLEREAQNCFAASRRALGTSPRALRTAAISDVFRTKASRAKKQAGQAESKTESKKTKGGEHR